MNKNTEIKAIMVYDLKVSAVIADPPGNSFQI